MGRCAEWERDGGEDREPAGEPVIATGPTVKLTDGDPPADKAFYTIGVSVP